jgi:hypothetical protein
MKGIKGHIIRFKSIEKVMNFVVIMGQKEEDRIILQVPHRQTNKLILGISFE